ncbi:MAG: hypothetical protein WAP03_13265 [Methylorubrum rhodinum]|uniref:hypothetical protein n=1 Tax=Methylorubrum rhodinum TaxID=29428 RepID=UPI003BB1C032
MSRHILVERPTIQVVLGFDHMLRSYFGQVFDPSDSDNEGMAVGGWPTASGLGTRRPVIHWAERNHDLRLLMTWARGQQPDRVWEHPEAAEHLEKLRAALRFEWEEGSDEDAIALPAVLQGELR